MRQLSAIYTVVSLQRLILYSVQMHQLDQIVGNCCHTSLKNTIQIIQGILLNMSSSITTQPVQLSWQCQHNCLPLQVVLGIALVAQSTS